MGETGIPSATGNVDNPPQQTPQPQRTLKDRGRQDTADQSQPDMLNIPHEGANKIPIETQQEVPAVTGANIDEQGPNQHDSSYLRLPILQGGAKERMCWRCGETGHSKRSCNRQVSCTFCQAYSHATKACKKYASFVRNSQGMSSKRTTPVQNHHQGKQQWNNQSQPHFPQGNYHFAIGPSFRFQPPVVPPLVQPPRYLNPSIHEK